MPAPLEFWFDFASTYSYVAALRVEDEAREAGVPVLFRPFLLGPLFSAQQGLKDSPFNAHPVRGRYMWRDLERLCARYALPWRRPSQFPRHSVLAGRVACVGEAEAWGARFVRAAFEANFAHDRDISRPEVLSEVLGALGVDAQGVLARAEAPENKARLRQRTEEAQAHGLFGAPSFRVEGELFFGQDRLEDALAWARGTAHRPAEARP